MLTLLRIHNMAIIEDLSFELGSGLNVLTGKTGAGKSILVAALQLVLGGRGRSELVRTGADRAAVEALFDVRDPALRDRLRAEGVEVTDELVIRRELLATGRTRATVNGRLTTATQLARLARDLVDISSQHQHHTLVDARTHMGHLDTFAGLIPDRAAVSTAWSAMVAARQALTEAEARLRDRADRVDLLRFQLDEVTRVAPQPGEDASLETEQRRLTHSGNLRHAAATAYHTLYAADPALCTDLSRLAATVTEAGHHDPTLAELAARLEEARLDLEETGRDLGQYAETLDTDPKRLAWVDERLHRLTHLIRKHGTDLDALLAWRDEAQAELDALHQGDAHVDRLSIRACEAAEGARQRAQALSHARVSAATDLGDAITAELSSLGMGGARVMVEVGPLAGDTGVGSDGARLTASGIDRVEFLIAPNPGEEPRPLARVASGGELSRSLLALKRVLAEAGPVGLYVFDEVDTGVGGAVAEVIGQKLAEVAVHHQVLCITHAPQVAAYGDRHLHVSKRVEAGRTYSSVERLLGEDRIGELARMLGGIEITPATRQAACDLRAAAIRAGRAATTRAGQAAAAK